MKYGKKLNRFEKREANADKLRHSLSGSGVYLYENITEADLTLPKPAASGIRVVGPHRRFQGDSYFMSWVGSPMNMLKVIEVIAPAITKRQETKMSTENKLILDQPDMVTEQGKVEFVVPTQPVQQLNDSNNPAAKTPEVLLTEDPLDGVEIILG